MSLLKPCGCYTCAGPRYQYKKYTSGGNILESRKRRGQAPFDIRVRILENKIIDMQVFNLSYAWEEIISSYRTGQNVQKFGIFPSYMYRLLWVGPISYTEIHSLILIEVCYNLKDV